MIRLGLRAIVIPAAIAMLLFLLIRLAFAQAPGTPSPAQPPALEEIDALRIGKLWAERQVLMEEYRRVQTEQANRDRLFQEKGAALDAVLAEAAKKAGLELKDGWKPDPEQRVWRKEQSR